MPSGASKAAMPADEVVDVGNVRDDVVCGDEAWPDALRHQLSRQVASEKARDGGDALGPGRRGHVSRRLDAEHVEPPLFEILQQIAVVARELHHAVAWA